MGRKWLRSWSGSSVLGKVMGCGRQSGSRRGSWCMSPSRWPTVCPRNRAEMSATSASHGETGRLFSARWFDLTVLCTFAKYMLLFINFVSLFKEIHVWHARDVKNHSFQNQKLTVIQGVFNSVIQNWKLFFHSAARWRCCSELVLRAARRIYRRF